MQASTILPIVAAARSPSTLRAAGHEPRLVATGGGSDANALVAAGYEAVLLANGTQANHTPEERVTEAAIAEMLSVCEVAIELVGDAEAA